MKRLGLLVFAALACGPEQTTVPPVGETVVYVDTDMPVPRIVGRLRIDFYTADHVWFESRDIARSKASDFPTSFGVYLPDPARAADVILRLRAYPQGGQRDYRGERFAERPPADAPPFDLTPAPEPTDQPRLVGETGDATPPSEPLPLLTIDRLVKVHVTPNTRDAVSVVLRGACVGTMADITHDTTCIEAEGVREPLAIEKAVPPPTKSVAGTFDFVEKCTASPRTGGAPLYDDEVCVDGALFILGSDDAFGFGADNSGAKHVAILPSFRIDKYEVTVGRFRKALADGLLFVNDPVLANDDAIPDGTETTDPRACTYSSEPIGREEFPVTCVPYSSARAFCRFLGGDLPTEAQWEYVAMHAARPAVTPFAWGGEPGIAAKCDQALFGRGALPVNDECNTDAKSFGPATVTARAGPGGDVSIALGVVNLIGGVTEMMLDSFSSLSSNCWNRQPLRSPACLDTRPETVTRGASWAAPHTSVFGGRRILLPQDGISPEVGFRCVRSGT